MNVALWNFLRRFTIFEWLMIATIVIAGFLTFRIVAVQGIGYDAVFDLEAYLAIRNMPSSLTLTDAYAVAPNTSEFYGLLTFQMADLLFPGDFNADSLDSYRQHYALIAGLSLLGAAGLGIGVGSALGKRGAGLFAAALLLSTPLWMGLGAIDNKDVPVATGLTLVSLALILARKSFTVMQGGGLTLLLGLGTFLAIGTRAGALALVVGLVTVVTVLQGIGSVWQRQWSGVLRIAVPAGLGIALSLLLLWFTNPFARIGFIEWLREAIEVSRKYEWIGLVRTAGQDLPSDQLPWWYAPSWLLAQLPLLTTILLVSALLVIARGILRGPIGLRQQLGRDIGHLMPLLVQGFVLPAIVIASGAVLYDGIRHLLFALPGVVSLMAIPVAWVLRSQPTHTRRRQLLSAGFVVVLFLSLFASIRWFPYPYAFINPIAGADRENRDWELDYWGMTSIEGMQYLLAEGAEPVVVIPAAETGRPLGSITADEGAAFTNATGQPHGVYVFRRWDAVFRQDWCTRTFTIQRDGHILGEGGTCP
jgi:hypothetical protein